MTQLELALNSKCKTENVKWQEYGLEFSWISCIINSLHKSCMYILCPNWIRLVYVYIKFSRFNYILRLVLDSDSDDTEHFTLHFGFGIYFSAIFENQPKCLFDWQSCAPLHTANLHLFLKKLFLLKFTLFGKSDSLFVLFKIWIEADIPFWKSFSISIPLWKKGFSLEIYNINRNHQWGTLFEFCRPIWNTFSQS